MNHFEKQLFQFPETKQYGSHMVMTNSKPETKYKYINIDTRFGDDFNNLDTANFNVNLPDKLTNIKSMSVTNVELPVSYYNISAALGNNIIYITNQNTNQTSTIIIPDNQYTLTSLQTELGLLLPSDLTFAIDTNGLSTFTTTTTPYTIYFTPYNIKFNITTDQDTIVNSKFQLGWLLGFRQYYYNIDINTTITSEFIPNLIGPRYIYLVIDEFQNGNQTSFISVLSTSIIRKNILARITTSYNDYPFGTIIPANLSNGLLTSDTRSYTGKIDIQRLNIQLVDENGQIINLNGDDVSFCLLLEYE
jgi:hypothetical protein